MGEKYVKKKRSGESKYQLAKEGANHKLDRILENLDKEKKDGKRISNK